MPASLAVARSALLSDQFPPLYDAASGGHHLTPRLVGFIRLVVILCVLRYLGCRPVVKLHSANIAAHFTSPHGGVLLHGQRLRWALCCDIWVLGSPQGPVLPNIVAHIFRCGGVSRPTRVV